MRKTRLNRVVAGAAALAAVSVGLFSASASALPPGSPSSGVVTVSPASGVDTTTLTLSPPAGAACPGDSATGGYRWQTFIAAASVDAGTLTYAGGAGPEPVAGAVVFPLLSSGGSVITDQTTSVGTALLTGIPTFDFSAFPAGTFPSGTYNIGFACTLNNATVSFWQSALTVTNPGGVFTFTSGAAPAVPAAPVLASPLTPGDTTLAGTFTEAAATPPVTGFTVTAVPTTGTTVTLPLAAGATSFTLTGLVNGTSYAVSLIATNTTGNSAPSNTVNGTPAVGSRPPVTNLTASPGPSSAVLTWTPPTGVAPTGYTIGVSPTVTGAPFTAAAGAVTFTVTGLTAGTSYTFTVTPTHPAPFVALPASITIVAIGDAVIIQDITVVRPAGTLVLTQVCGLYGALPAEPASPGFPALPALPAAGTGTAPTLTVGGAPDPQFPNYPNPPTPSYPTHCGIDLGTSALVTSGAGAGQFYAATGRLNQVTVSDTRDLDAGWTLNGTASAFTVSGGGASFSGDALGWTPVKTSDSNPVTPGGYDQIASAGATVLPNASPGLGSAKVLGLAAPGAGLGVAQFDARLKLLIPSTARAGTYNGTLTFTVV